MAASEPASERATAIIATHGCCSPVDVGAGGLRFAVMAMLATGVAAAVALGDGLDVALGVGPGVGPAVLMLLGADPIVGGLRTGELAGG